jgi:hypothetical protein
MLVVQKARLYVEKRDSVLWNDVNHTCEEKYNGHRILLRGPKSFSANGKEKDIEFLKAFGLKNTVKLDGEVIVRRDLGLQQGHGDVSHWLANDESKLEYVVFDILMCGDKDISGMRWIDRLEQLNDFFGGLVIPANIRISQSRLFKHGWYRKEYDDIVGRGGEGVVFKYHHSTWSPASRSGWVKVKAYKDYDVVITNCDALPSGWRVRPGAVDPQTGLILPDGDHTSSWKAGYVNLSYGFYDQHGRLRTVGSLGFTGPRSELEQHVGKVAIVKGYGEQFESGSLQHPVFQSFRDDKDACDCVFNFQE